MIVVEYNWQSEIDDLKWWVVGFGQQQEILWFEVAMTDAVLVAVIDSLHDLQDSDASLVLWEVPFVNDSVE